MMRSLLAVLIVLVRSLHLALDSRLGQTMRCPTRRQAGAPRPSYDHPQNRTHRHGHGHARARARTEACTQTHSHTHTHTRTHMGT